MHQLGIVVKWVWGFFVIKDFNMLQAPKIPKFIIGNIRNERRVFARTMMQAGLESRLASACPAISKPIQARVVSQKQTYSDVIPTMHQRHDVNKPAC